MTKLKTHKATAKRFKITKNRKIKKKICGQDHFNAKESGKTGRNKKRQSDMAKSHTKTIKRLIPYN